MPDLPTFTVSQATAQRLMAAFSGQDDRDGNPLTPTQAYRRWLRERLVLHVTEFESRNDKQALSDELGP